jgi:transposase-like protein
MLYYGLHWNQHMRVAPSIILTEEQKNELTRLSRSGRTSVRLAERSRIVLLAAQGLQNKEIAEQLGVGRVQVARWRQRYLESGIEGIERDLPRGAPPVKVDVKQLVELTTQSKPEAATHWSTRTLAAELGVAPSTVGRPPAPRGGPLSRHWTTPCRPRSCVMTANRPTCWCWPGRGQAKRGCWCTGSPT